MPGAASPCDLFFSISRGENSESLQVGGGFLFLSIIVVHPMWVQLLKSAALLAVLCESSSVRTAREPTCSHSWGLRASPFFVFLTASSVRMLVN